MLLGLALRRAPSRAGCLALPDSATRTAPLLLRHSARGTPRKDSLRSLLPTLEIEKHTEADPIDGSPGSAQGVPAERSMSEADIRNTTLACGRHSVFPLWLGPERRNHDHDRPRRPVAERVGAGADRVDRQHARSRTPRLPRSALIVCTTTQHASPNRKSLPWPAATGGSCPLTPQSTRRSDVVERGARPKTLRT